DHVRRGRARAAQSDRHGRPRHARPALDGRRGLLGRRSSGQRLPGVAGRDPHRRQTPDPVAMADGARVL
ncbi:MAG: hypothetical protein AVDCRST_MAG91-2622, partial [uncultured Sphingomonadaceae bacterium]